jgi:hypothetical protein
VQDNIGGPGAGVLLRRQLDEVDRLRLHEYINQIGDPGKDGDFQVTRIKGVQFDEPKSLPGGGSVSGSCPFGFSLEPIDDEHLIAAGIETFEGAFGFRPVRYVGFCAYCNGRVDHRVLGEIVAKVAEMFDGVVDFGGTLWPLVPVEYGRPFSKARERARWSVDFEPLFQDMIRGMPGRIVGIAKVRCDGKEDDPSHYADPKFLRAWLRHPQFYMIK